jgi:hypothetical protein
MILKLDENLSNLEVMVLEMVPEMMYIVGADIVNELASRGQQPKACLFTDCHHPQIVLPHNVAVSGRITQCLGRD